MQDHSHGAGPLVTLTGFLLGLVTNALDYLDAHATGITCLFMIISVIGGLWLQYRRNKILAGQAK